MLVLVAQEALRNVVRQSCTDRAAVELSSTALEICLRVSDDGAEFDPVAVARDTGLGLVSTRERLTLAGGKLTIDAQSAGVRGSVLA